MSSSDNSEKYFGVMIFHLYNGEFNRTMFVEVTEQRTLVKELSNGEKLVEIVLLPDRNEIQVVESLSNRFSQIDLKRDDFKNIVEKRLEDIRLLSVDVDMAFRNLPIDEEIDLSSIEMLTSMIQNHKRELKKIVENNGNTTVYATQKITVYTLKNGVETPINHQIVATWCKRNIGSKAARKTSMEKVTTFTSSMCDDHYINSIKGRIGMGVTLDVTQLEY